MLSLYITVILLTLSLEICALSVFNGVSVLNNQCISTFTGINGICLKANECPEFKTFRNQLEICAFNGRTPFICCPKNIANRNSVKRISAQKCEEYSDRRNKLLKSLVGFVGGTAASKSEFPHMAAIGTRARDGKVKWYCGASLISEKFLLGVAHCTRSPDGNAQIARLGDIELRNDFSDPNNFKIKNTIPHPNYQRRFKYSDIALYELEQNIRFGPSISPACLHQGDDLSRFIPTAIGWGDTSYGGEWSNTLIKGSLNILSNAECNVEYDNVREIPYGIVSDQICAWDPNGERDTCNGDSGGPLQISKTFNGQTIHEIIGLTSFGRFCAAGFPGVYTKVSPYLDWIERIVWTNN